MSLGGREEDLSQYKVPSELAQERLQKGQWIGWMSPLRRATKHGRTQRANTAHCGNHAAAARARSVQRVIKHVPDRRERHLEVQYQVGKGG